MHTSAKFKGRTQKNMAYTDLKMAILDPTSHAKQPNITNQKNRESNFEDPHPPIYATVRHTEPMHVEEMEVIPEQQTECIISTVHPDNLHRPLVTVCAVQTHNEISQLCSLMTSAESKPLPKIPIVNTSRKRTCSTQRPTNSHQAHEITTSSLNMDQRQLRPCGSAYLGLHQFTPPN